MGVTAPANVYTGMPFQVDVGGQKFNVTCPQNAGPGQKIQIELPASSGGHNSSTTTGGHDSSTTSNSGSNMALHYVTVPPGVYTGMPFQVNVNGQTFRVTCPQNAVPGQRIQISLPTGGSSNSASQTSHSSSNRREQSRSRSPKPKSGTQLFDVTVPPGIRPGQQFKIKAQGQEFLVTCPPNAGPGRKIRVPVRIGSNDPPGTSNNHGLQ